MEEKILELLEARKFGELKGLLSEINPADLVVYFEAIPKNKQILVFRILPKELAAETFVEMDSDMQMLLITAFSDKEIHDILAELFVFLQNRPIKRQVRWFVLCMSIILGTVFTCAMMNYIYEKVHSIRNIWYGITTLSSRTIIWRSLVDVFQDYPQNLIYGFPYNEGMAVVNKYLCSIYDLDVVAHMHSGYLQTFLYTGFPGFVAVIIFAIYVTWVSGKLFLAPAECGVSLEEKMLVLIPVICFIMNLVESVLFYNAPSMEIMNMLVMLCSGYILEIKREKMPNC